MTRIWYSDTVDQSSPDAMHHVLAYGTIEEIRSLKKALGERRLRDLFLRYPKKLYTGSALAFVKDFVLQITHPIDEQRYLKHTPRYLG